jgi:hypothetical protein
MAGRLYVKLQRVKTKHRKAWAKVSLLSFDGLVNLPAKPLILSHDSILQKIDSFLKISK